MAKEVKQTGQETQAPQFPEDKHGPGYDNDTSGWVHGEGGDATTKPGFDHTRKRK